MEEFPVALKTVYGAHRTRASMVSVVAVKLTA
jgi:hypothetical protein